MTNLSQCKEFLRSFNGAHDDWADLIEKLEKIREIADALIFDIYEGGKADIYHPKVCALVYALSDTDPKPEGK